MRFDTFSFSSEHVHTLKTKGFNAVFDESLQRIADMKMYEEFTAKGWTQHIARETKDTLVPEIIRVVMLGWYAAVIESEDGA